MSSRNTRTTLALVGSWLGLLIVAGLLMVLFGLMGSMLTGSALASLVLVVGATVAAIAFVLSDVHHPHHPRHR
jgi:hypothetical protein